jgi:PAS domain S-box-containing protein
MKTERRPTAYAAPNRFFGHVWRTPPAARYAIAVGAAVLGIFVRRALDPLWGDKLPLIMAFPAIAGSAWFGGFWPGMVTTVVSALAAEYLWMPPVGSLALIDWGDVVGLVVFVVTGAFISALNAAWRRAATRVAASEERLRATLDGIGDAVIATDEQGRITRLNEVAAALTGWTEAEALGRPLSEVFVILDEQSRQPAENPVERVVREGVISGLANHTLLVSRDGRETNIDDSAAPIRTAEGVVAGAVMVFRDISERRRVERERAALLENERTARADKERLAEDLRHLQALTDTALATDDVEALIRKLLPRVREVLASDTATILLVDSAGTHLTPVASDGLEAELGKDIRIPVGSGVAGRIAVGHQATVIDDLRQEAVVSPILNERVRSLVGVPLRVGGRLLGVIQAGMSTARKFTEDDVRLLTLAAERVALAIERARLYENERALRIEAETAAEQLRLALEAGDMGTWDYTIGSGEVKLSPGLEAIHGHAPGGFSGTFEAFGEEIHTDDRQHVLDSIGGAVSQRSDLRVEYRIVRRDGMVRWVEARGQLFCDAEGEPERIVGVCLDVTARKHAEEKFRLAIEAAPAAVIMVDRGGTIVLINALTERLLGYARDELVGQPVDRLVPQRFRGQHAEHRAGFFRDSRQRPMGAGRDLYALRKDGSEVPVEIGLSPLETPEGRFVLAAVTDITARKRAERALQDVDRRKDEFLAMLSHEMRNPLGAIANAAHLLKQLGPQEGNLRWARDVVARQAAHLTRIVDDLLDVSRISRGQLVLRRQPIPVASALALALETALPLIEARRQKFTSKVPPDAIWVDGDATRLAQVIGNLLSNASRYTGQGGSISLTVGREAAEVALRVRDTGIGISAEVLPRLFDQFAQAERPLDRAPGGLGLGLTLARRLTEMHGGKLEAFSAGVGKGSEFVVRLPVLTGAPPVEVHPRPILKYEVARRRILVVDDNVDYAEALSLALGATGHEVRLAADGLSALQAADEFQPDVVLLDIGLPGIDGYEVGRRLRAARGPKGVVLVALTGHGREEDRRQARDAGFDHHLVKPVTPDAIVPLLGPTRPSPPPS